MKKFKLTILTGILFLTLLIIKFVTNEFQQFVTILLYVTLITYIVAFVSELYNSYMNPFSRNPEKIIDEALKGIVNPEMSDSEKEQLIKSFDSVRKKGRKNN